MKRLFLFLLLSFFAEAGSLFADNLADILPADGKILVALNRPELLNGIISATGMSTNDAAEFKTLLSAFDTTQPIYLVFKDLSLSKDSVQNMDKAMNSNMVICGKPVGSFQDFTKAFQSVIHEKIEKISKNMVKIDEAYILYVRNRYVAISPSKEGILSYKNGETLQNSQSSDAVLFRKYIAKYADKDAYFLAVPSLLSNFVDQGSQSIPPSLKQFDFSGNVEMYTMTLDTLSKGFELNLSIRLSKASPALANIFKAHKTFVTERAFSAGGVSGYAELSLSPGFLQDVMNFISAMQGEDSKMPTDTINGILSKISGNFAVSLYNPINPNIGKSIKSDPKLLVFIGAESDKDAKDILGSFEKQASFKKTKIAGKRVYAMNLDESNTVYIAVNKSFLVAASSKKLMSDYLRHSKAGKKSFQNPLVSQVTDNEGQGLSVLVHSKELLSMLMRKMKIKEIPDYQEALIYIGPSKSADALDIKLIVK